MRVGMKLKIALFPYPKIKKGSPIFIELPLISDGVISYNVSAAIVVSIAIVSTSIAIVSASIVIVVESTAASSEGLLVQDAKAIIPPTNANASTFFIFCSVYKVVDAKVLLKNKLQTILDCIFLRT